MRTRKMANTMENWSVLSQLKLKYVTKIKWVYVFGVTGNDVIFATKGDNVYAFGSNIDGCLGLGHNKAVSEPSKVNELCKKQVTNVCYSYFDGGHNFVLALTKCGHVYSWGSNKCGQLGNGSVFKNYRPNLIHDLTIKCFTDIACGLCHCLALAQTGEVFAWGCNEDGRVGYGNDISPLMTPIQVTELSRKKVVAIGCGLRHSLALTDTGVVYGWGYNSEGELGNRNNTEQILPIKVCVADNVVISKIACGSSHSLLLSTDGDIYCFGRNDCGQIGDQTIANRNIPIKLSLSTKFVDISAFNRGNISMAVSQNGYCFVWGQCAHEVIAEPKQTSYLNVNDVFMHYSKLKVTLKPLYFDVKAQNPLMFQRLGKAFNDPKYSDLVFKIEDKCIYTQKQYLKCCCKHFDVMLSEHNWLESNKSEIEITQYSYTVYYAFLRYLYTNSVDISYEDAFELLDLANSYFEEELKQKCTEIMKYSITVENFCSVYSTSIRYKSRELEDHCFDFALNKMPEICNTDGYEQMDCRTVKQLLKRLSHYIHS